MLYQTTFQDEEEPAQCRISCFGYRSDRDGQYPLHCHTYYEVAYLLEGRRYQYCNGESYEVGAGSFFLIPPLCVHGSKNITPCKDLVIQFDGDFLANASASFHRGNALGMADVDMPYLDCTGTSDLTMTLERIFHLRNYAQRDSLTYSIASEWEISSLVIKMLGQLLREEKLQVKEGPAQQSELPLLTGIINHILAHPDQKLDMYEAAKLSGISYYNFSRFFKGATGLCYSEYCNLLRIRYAEDMLIHSNKSIAEVAAAIGIDTASYFTRLFKKVSGCTPMQYRQKHKKLLLT